MRNISLRSVLVSTLIVSTYCAIDFDITDIELPFNKCNSTSQLIKTVFPWDNTVYFVLENRTHNFLLAEIINPHILIIPDEPLKLKLISYNNNYVIFTKDHISLNSTIRKLEKYEIWDQSSSPRGKFLIILTSEQSNVADIFKVLFGFDIISIVVVSNNNDVYSWNLLAQGCECGKFPKPYLMSNNSNNNVGISFNNDFKDFNHCTIKLVSKYKVTRNFKESPFSTILVKMIDVLAKLLNATSSDIVTENQKDFLYNKEEGVTLSIVYSRSQEFIENYDLSDLVHEDEIVWAVPKPQKIANVKVIVCIFRENVWGVMVLIFVTVVFTWWISAKYSYQKTNFKDFFQCFFAVLSFSVGASFNLNSISSSAKCLVIFYLFYSILVSTSFQANLIGDLTRPAYEHGINTIEELSESSLTIVAHDGGKSNNSKKSQNNHNDDGMKNKMAPQSRLNLTEFLQNVAYYRNSTIPIGKRALKIFAKDGTDVDIVESTESSSIHLLAIMRKGHYFMPIFNRYINRMVEYGFHEKILSDAEGRKYSLTEENLKVALTLEHLLSVFVLWSTGILCAIVSFLLEFCIPHAYTLVTV